MTDTIELDPFGSIMRPDAEPANLDNLTPVRDAVPGKIPNGVFTMVGGRGHRTFKVKTVLEGPLKGKRILYIMTGPDNVHDYTGVAFVNDDDTVSIWRRLVDTENGKLARVFWKMVTNAPLSATDPRTLAEVGYRLETSKNCIACNRLLTNPVSIDLGIGPECGGRS